MLLILDGPLADVALDDPAVVAVAEDRQLTGFGRREAQQFAVGEHRLAAIGERHQLRRRGARERVAVLRDPEGQGRARAQDRLLAGREPAAVDEGAVATAQVLDLPIHPVPDDLGVDTRDV